MTASAQELVALDELENRINTWFSQHTASYNMKKDVPANESIIYANIQLIDAGSIIKNLPSSSRVLKHLRRQFAYVASVKLEPETQRITILISQNAPLNP